MAEEKRPDRLMHSPVRVGVGRAGPVREVGLSVGSRLEGFLKMQIRSDADSHTVNAFIPVKHEF